MATEEDQLHWPSPQRMNILCAALARGQVLSNDNLRTLREEMRIG